jgi:hypothetical protein
MYNGGLDKPVHNFGQKTTRERLLERSRKRWKENVEVNPAEIDCENAEWIQQTQNRFQWQTLMNMIVNLWVPYKQGIS